MDAMAHVGLARYGTLVLGRGFRGVRNGCVAENGDIQLPVYCNKRNGEQYASTVLRCRLEGNELK